MNVPLNSNFADKFSGWGMNFEDGMAAGGMPDSGGPTGEEDGIILIR